MSKIGGAARQHTHAEHPFDLRPILIDDAEGLGGVDALEARIHDQGELAAHAIGVLEPQRVERAEVLDVPVAGAARHEPFAQRGERLGRARGEGEVVEVTALEHRREPFGVCAAADLGGMDPRVLPRPHDGVSEGRCGLA